MCSDKSYSEGESFQKTQDFPFRQTPSGHFKIFPDQVLTHFFSDKAFFHQLINNK